MEYQLTKEENNKLDEYWKFINIFNPNDEFNVYNYRKNLVKTIKNIYTIEEFYLYEKILNKMLWNLLIIYNIKIYTIDLTVKEGFVISCNKSYTNKQIMIINNRMILFPNYAKLNENKNIPENLYKIFYILSKRKLYEKVINDKNYIDIIKINKKKYYYPNDYPFPNISLIEYNTNEKKIWLKRIKAYYYYKDDSKWYKLIT